MAIEAKMSLWVDPASDNVRRTTTFVSGIADMRDGVPDFRLVP